MQRIKQLDGLRCVAIFWVMVQHLATRVGSFIPTGYFGVELFFVISGFLITTILLQTDEPFRSAYPKFMGRRALRIFPIYYLTLFVLFAVHFIPRQEWIFFATYTYNYALAYNRFPFNPATHFWSLCVEEQFYLLWPLVVLGLGHRRKMLTGILLFLAVACAWQLRFGSIPAVNRYNTLGLFPRGLGLLLGALGALYYRKNPISSKWLSGPWLEWLNYGILLFFLASHSPFKWVVFPWCALILVLKAVYGGFHFRLLDVFLRNRFVVYTGMISYGIYVFHLPLAYFLTNYVFDPLLWNKLMLHQTPGAIENIKWIRGFTRLPLYGLLTFCLAHLSFTYFERPLLSLKSKFFPYPVKAE